MTSDLVFYDYFYCIFCFIVIRLRCHGTVCFASPPEQWLYLCFWHAYCFVFLYQSWKLNDLIWFDKWNSRRIYQRHHDRSSRSFTPGSQKHNSIIVIMKLFKTSNVQIVKYCKELFNFELPGIRINRLITRNFCMFLLIISFVNILRCVVDIWLNCCKSYMQYV